MVRLDYPKVIDRKTNDDDDNDDDDDAPAPFNHQTDFLLFLSILSDRVGCYGSFHSTFLGSFRDEIQWFVPPFSKQMQKMVDKCARLVVTKGLRYFGVENFGNCYGAKDYSSGGEPMALECNFGVGLENFFFIYKVST